MTEVKELVRQSVYIPQELGQSQKCPFCETVGYLVNANLGLNPGSAFYYALYCPKCSPEAERQERDASRIRCAGLRYPNAREIRVAQGIF